MGSGDEGRRPLRLALFVKEPKGSHGTRNIAQVQRTKKGGVEGDRFAFANLGRGKALTVFTVPFAFI